MRRPFRAHGSPAPALDLRAQLAPLGDSLEANKNVLKVATELMRDIEALPLPRQAKDRLSERYAMLDRKVTLAIKALDRAVDAYASAASPPQTPPLPPAPAAGGPKGVS